MIELPENLLTEQIIGAAIEVHRCLGPGLLENAYEMCLAQELTLRGIPFERQVPLPVSYKGIYVEAGYKIDLFIDQRVIVELKAVNALADIHDAQVMTYLKLTNCRVGLLLNFNVRRLKDGGIRRILLT